MRVMVLYNPVSGRGKGCTAAGAISQALLQAHCDVELIPTQAEPPEQWLVQKLTVKPDVVVVVGGDGTLRQVASALVSSRVPVFHAPSGTENLFATSMGMTSDPESIVTAVFQQSVESLDTATANGTFMLLMASVGFDADVVADLAKHRGSSITRLSYVKPFIRQLMRWKPPEITICVEGKLVVDRAHGWAIIANSCAYACGTNLVRDADMRDGTLDVVFFPFKGRLHSLLWVIRLLRGTHLKHRASVTAKGKRIVVQSTNDAPWQLDGDPFGNANEMVIVCKQASLEILQQVVAVDDSACDRID